MQDLRRQVVIAVRWLPLVLIGAIIAGFIAYSVTSGQPKIYEATARLIVDPGQSPTSQDLAVAQEQVGLYAGLADSRPVAEAVIESLGLDVSPESVLARISTSIEAPSLSLAIRIRDQDPEAALLLAQTVGEEMRLRVRDRLMTDQVKEADRAIKANQDAIRFSQRRLDSLIAKPNKTLRDRMDVQALFSQISSLQSDTLQLQPSSSAFVRNRLNWFEEPSAPSSPVEPRPTYWTLLALVVGGLLGLATGFVIEFLNGKVRDERDLELATGLAVLGSISERRRDIGRSDAERLVMQRHPETESADAYRSLRARISLASGSARTLLVAGPDGSGKSVVAANLAFAYAEAGSTVILVDADHRSPRLHSFFGVPNDRGLSMLLRDAEVPLDHVTFPTPHPRLRLMSVGPPAFEASELLGSPQVPKLLGRLLQVADMVIFDSPSLTANLDAAMLAGHLQASILVIPSGSRVESAKEAARVLDTGDAHLAGPVLYRTTRGSHKRTSARPATSLPIPHLAIPSVRTSPPATSHAASPPVSEPTDGPTSPSTPTYLLEAFLYRIIRGPYARPVTKPETGSVNGKAGTTSSPNGLAASTSGVIESPTRQLKAQGTPAQPWPDHPGPTVVVPLEPPVGVSMPPAIGPYAGGFKPGEGDR